MVRIKQKKKKINEKRITYYIGTDLYSAILLVLYSRLYQNMHCLSYWMSHHMYSQVYRINQQECLINIWYRQSKKSVKLLE